MRRPASAVGRTVFAAEPPPAILVIFAWESIQDRRHRPCLLTFPQPQREANDLFSRRAGNGTSGLRNMSGRFVGARALPFPDQQTLQYSLCGPAEVFGEERTSALT